MALEEREAPPEHHVALVMDWKENLSLPIAGVETSTMYWTSERMPLSCFGPAVYQNVGGGRGIATQYVPSVSNIMDHSCEASAATMRLCSWSEDKKSVQHTSVWMGCAAAAFQLFRREAWQGSS